LRRCLATANIAFAAESNSFVWLHRESKIVEIYWRLFMKTKYWYFVNDFGIDGTTNRFCLGWQHIELW
jgi:hypothetical protein